jgi:hypothetical protein
VRVSGAYLEVMRTGRAVQLPLLLRLQRRRRARPLCLPRRGPQPRLLRQAPRAAPRLQHRATPRRALLL